MFSVLAEYKNHPSKQVVARSIRAGRTMFIIGAGFFPLTGSAVAFGYWIECVPIPESAWRCSGAGLPF